MKSPILQAIDKFDENTSDYPIRTSDVIAILQSLLPAEKTFMEGVFDAGKDCEMKASCRGQNFVDFEQYYSQLNK